MNNDIKEILNEIGYRQHIHGYLTLNPKELDILAHWIIDIQEENERLKMDIRYREDKWQYTKFSDKDYKSRNEKGIEYINKHLYMESTCGIQHPTFDGKPSYDFDCFELENILKGENN